MMAACARETVGDPPVTEFVAHEADFSGYRSWAAIGEPRRGPDPAGRTGVGSHGSNDSALVRTVRLNRSDASVDSSGNYPIGTIFLKEVTRDGSTESITAMVKRGGGFNSTGRGWEYFIIENGTVLERGAGIDGNRCALCHGHSSAGNDFIFTHP
jgi:hypothetical protein